MAEIDRHDRLGFRDYDLCARVMGQVQQGAHLVDDVVSARELGSVPRRHRKRHPSISVRVRTGSGPPSADEEDLKNLEIEKVLQGGAAMMAAYSPHTMRLRSLS